MYIFHRTSEEKLHIEAPLLVESWNFISTLKSRINPKKVKEKYPNTGGNSETVFSSECLREPRLLYKWPLCESGRSAPPTHGIQGSNTANVQSVWHCQTSCPSTRGCTQHPGVCVEEGRGKIEWSRAVRSSRSLHRRWPSCHQSQSRCICRPSRCHS